MINLCKSEKGGPGSGWATGKKKERFELEVVA